MTLSEIPSQIRKVNWPINSKRLLLHCKYFKTAHITTFRCDPISNLFRLNVVIQEICKNTNSFSFFMNHNKNNTLVINWDTFINTLLVIKIDPNSFFRGVCNKMQFFSCLQHCVVLDNIFFNFSWENKRCHAQLNQKMRHV